MSEPDLIRNDSPHQVTLPQGAKVAAGKKAKASEPSVRKALPNSSGTPTIEEPLADIRVAVPDDELPEAEAEQPSFDRERQDNHVLIEAADEAPHISSDGPAIDQALNDRQVLLPPSEREEVVQAEIIALPEASKTPEPSPGLVIERSEDDNFIALPENEQSASPGTFELASQEPSEPLPEIPVAEAPTFSVHPPPRAEVDIEPALKTVRPTGIAERLGQLKVANGQTRSKLDALQSLDPQPMHFSRH